MALEGEGSNCFSITRTSRTKSNYQGEKYLLTKKLVGKEIRHARLRKTCINLHNCHVSETRDTKAKLVKIHSFIHSDVKSVEIQPKLYLKTNNKKLETSAMTDNTLMNCKESKSELDQVGG